MSIAASQAQASTASGFWGRSRAVNSAARQNMSTARTTEGEPPVSQA